MNCWLTMVGRAICLLLVPLLRVFPVMSSGAVFDGGSRWQQCAFFDSTNDNLEYQLHDCCSAWICVFTLLFSFGAILLILLIICKLFCHRYCYEPFS